MQNNTNASLCMRPHVGTYVGTLSGAKSLGEEEVEKMWTRLLRRTSLPMIVVMLPECRFMKKSNQSSSLCTARY